MAYASKMDDTYGNYTYDDFLKCVENIEKWFPIGKHKLRTQLIYDLTLYHPSYFVKTTVSDVREVFGPINMSALTRIEGSPTIITLRDPRPKEFKGKIRFTPQNTLAFSQYVVCLNNNRDMTFTSVNVNSPVLQKEKYLITECDAAYASDEKDCNYSEIEKNAWAFLEQDKRFAIQNNNQVSKNVQNEMSKTIHEMFCLCSDIFERWCVTYEWNNALFAIPMPPEAFKTIFKTRDKVGGRRRVMPVIVKEHKRKGIDVVSHIRMYSDYICMNGRKFGVYVGSENFGTILHSERQIKNMKKRLSNAEVENIGGQEFYVMKAGGAE